VGTVNVRNGSKADIHSPAEHGHDVQAFTRHLHRRWWRGNGPFPLLDRPTRENDGAAKSRISWIALLCRLEPGERQPPLLRASRNRLPDRVHAPQPRLAPRGVLHQLQVRQTRQWLAAAARIDLGDRRAGHCGDAVVAGLSERQPGTHWHGAVAVHRPRRLVGDPRNPLAGIGKQARVPLIELDFEQPRLAVARFSWTTVLPGISSRAC
jgi:hypothetical protein